MIFQNAIFKTNTADIMVFKLDASTLEISIKHIYVILTHIFSNISTLNKYLNI